jgi:hypothetical protein
MKEQKNIRKAIIHARFRRRESGWFYVPWLNLNGIWLTNAGFNPGDAIEIIVKRKTLIIKNITTSKDNEKQV